MIFGRVFGVFWEFALIIAIFMCRNAPRGSSKYPCSVISIFTSKSGLPISKIYKLEWYGLHGKTKLSLNTNAYRCMRCWQIFDVFWLCLYNYEQNESYFRHTFVYIMNYWCYENEMRVGGIEELEVSLHNDLCLKAGMSQGWVCSCFCLLFFSFSSVKFIFSCMCLGACSYRNLSLKWILLNTEREWFSKLPYPQAWWNSKQR